MQKTILDLLITGSLFLFVTVLGMVGFGFMVAGVYMLLAVHQPAWAAALLTGCAVLLLAILVLLVFRLAKGGSSSARDDARGAARSEDERGARPRGDTRQDAERNAELFELAVELAGKSGLTSRDATVIALIAGTVVGVSPALRAQILGMFTGSQDDAGR